MGKKPCILGKNCPNKIAKRSFSNLLSDDESDVSHNNLKENCVFCGSITIKKKKKPDTSSLWSSSSNESVRMKRPIVTEIDSFCGMRNTGKKKKDNTDENFEYLLKKVLKGSSLKKDDDDDELSDSGVKLDFDSPGFSGADVKRNNAINSFKSQTDGFKSSPIQLFQRNGLKDTFTLSAHSNFKMPKTSTSTFTFSSPDTTKDKESPLMSGNSSSASEFSPIRKKKNIFRINSPVSEASSYDSPFKKDNSMDESDPFEFDSDHESKKPAQAISVPSKVSDLDNDDEFKKPTQSLSLWPRDKDFDSDDEQINAPKSSHSWSKNKILDSDDEQENPPRSSSLFSKDKDLDSDNEQSKPNQSVHLYSRDKDLEEAGPSSRPDMVFENDSPQPSSRHNARFMNLSYLPKHKVERLLFKSFKLQLINEFSSSSDEEDIWLTKEVKKDRKRKRSKQSNPVTDKRLKSDVKIGSGFYRWKKRRRTHNYLSDEDSNLTFESTNDASDVDDSSDNMSEDDNINIRNIPNTSANNQDHDYSTSEFKKIAEANIDNLAFETEKLNWDDTVMIDDATMDSAIITIDDSPQRFDLPLLEPTEGVITLDETDTSNTTKSKSPDKSPDINNSDHIYCVTEIKSERPEGLSCLKQSVADKLSGIINLPESSSNDGSDKTEEYSLENPVGPNPNVPNDKEDSPSKKKTQWECPICMEQSNGQEIATTVCGHIFCKDCIESYLVTSPQCPICRKEVDKRQLITLFLYNHNF